VVMFALFVMGQMVFAIRRARRSPKIEKAV
jgi:hypothetical protein